MATARDFITTTINPIINRVTHPLYNMWNERKNKNQLCSNWVDFENFVIGVGERPIGDFRMGRFNTKNLFGSDNFYWKEYVKRKEGETVNQQRIRRRQENLEIYKHNELMKTYALSLEEYNKILEFQNFVCKICNEPEKVKHHITNRVKSLAVDHCHKSGKIRGLLCQRCNRTLGKLKDSVILLDKMKAYLNDYG